MDRYLVISSDGHAGPPPERYRDYLDPKYRPIFDERVAGEIRAREDAESQMQIRDFNARWRGEVGDGLLGAFDSDVRNRVLDADGVVAEVLYSDGLTERNSPPFNAGMGPDGADPVLQWAGSRAHNRWMAEFCRAAPLRRLGMGVVPAAWDMDQTLTELRWIKENGLRGALLPVILPGVESYNSPKYYPMWELICDLGLVANFHAGVGPRYDTTAPGWLGVYLCEYPFWFTRPLFALIFGGVFDRYPGLKVQFTEAGGDFWWPWMLQMMDFRAAPKKASAKIADHSARLSMKPSEFFRRNVWIGSSAQMDDARMDDYHKLGVGRVMWGTDYPHPEGTWPRTGEQMTGALVGLTETELEAVLGLNIAKLYDLDLPALNAIAARIGPKKSSFAKAA
jgi:predicted TIM-barrel fold metal-dependent hydrolase